MPLVRRDKQTIAPTEVGRTMAAELTVALDLMEAALAHAKTDIEVLRLQASPSFAIRWLVPKLEHITKIAPELDLAVTTTLLHDQLVNDRFDHRSFDAGIIYGDGEWPELEKVLLQREYLVPVISPNLAKKSGRVAIVRDLENQTLLHAKIDHSDWSNWLRAVGAQRIACDTGPAFETMDLAIGAAESGFGITLGNLAFIKSSIDAGMLTIPFGPAVYAGKGYYLVYPKTAEFSASIKRCFSWIRENSPEMLGTVEEILEELDLESVTA